MKKPISDKMLRYAFEMCVLIESHTDNVIAYIGKDEEIPASDIAHNKKAKAFIRAYKKYKNQV